MNPRIAITLLLIMLFALGANAQDSDEFFSLEVLAPSATIQACQTQDFVIEVGNFGSFIETYELSIDSFVDGATFSENPITLTPQETRQVTISVTPDCNVYGLHDVVFTLENVALGTLYEDFFELEIEPTDIPIIAENIDRLQIGYERSSLSIPIRNIGSYDTTYDLFVEGEQWLSIEEDELTVEGKSIGTLTLISSPLESTEADDYDITLVLRVKSTGVEYAKKFTVSLVGPSMFEGLVEEYGALAYGGLGALIFLLISLFALVLYLRATKDERAERREERRKEKELKKLEKQKIREQKQLEKEQARQEKQRLHEEVESAKLAAKEAKIKEREDAKLTREKEREERILSKETSFLENKRQILLRSLYSSLNSDYLYINKETLLPEGKSYLKSLFAVLFVAVTGVFGFLNWSTLTPYIWYVVGGALIVVLSAIALSLFLRLRVQRLQDFFEGRNEYQNIHAQALMDLKERYHLLTKASVNALRTTLNVLAPFIFFVFFAAILAVTVVISGFLGSFASYVMIGFGLLASAFLFLFLVKLGMRKKSVRLFRLSELAAGKSYPLTVSTQDGLGEIILRVKKGIECVYFAVHNLHQLDVFVAPNNPVYRAFELKAAGMIDRDMDKSTIRFSVRKRWLNRNMIDKDKVRLERYANNRWVGITDVKIISEDDKSVTYETSHSGLGLLVITGKQGTLKVVVEPKKKEKIAAKTAFKPKKKDKSLFPWLNVLLGTFFVLIFLTIAGIFLYAWIDPAPVTGNTDTISQATTDAEQLTDSVAGIDSAEKESGIGPFEIIAGETLDVDLSAFFSDPDEDVIVFSHTGGGNLAIYYTDNVAHITNAAGFTGEDSLVFVATDSSDQSTQSNTVKVTVKSPTGFSGLTHLFSGTLGFILLGIGIVIVFVLAMELRKRLHEDDDLNDEDIE